MIVIEALRLYCYLIYFPRFPFCVNSNCCRCRWSSWRILWLSRPSWPGRCFCCWRAAADCSDFLSMSSTSGTAGWRQEHLVWTCWGEPECSSALSQRCAKIERHESGSALAAASDVWACSHLTWTVWISITAKFTIMSVDVRWTISIRTTASVNIATLITVKRFRFDPWFWFCLSFV